MESNRVKLSSLEAGKQIADLVRPISHASALAALKIASALVEEEIKDAGQQAYQDVYSSLSASQQSPST